MAEVAIARADDNTKLPPKLQVRCTVPSPLISLSLCDFIHLLPLCPPPRPCYSASFILLQIPFDAVFYHVDPSAPYVAKLQLPEKGYRIPAKGIIRLIISNPSGTPLKTFLVQYDLTDMPPEHKVILQTIGNSLSVPHLFSFADVSATADRQTRLGHGCICCTSPLLMPRAEALLPRQAHQGISRSRF
jgi:hypothetical protein